MPFHLVGHALGYRNQQVIADVVTKGIVDRFEAVEIHKHQRKLRALAVGLVDCLLEAILQQDAVRQSRQVIVQRQLRQLAVGLCQRAREDRGARLHTRVEHRNQQRNAEDRQRHYRDQHRQPVAVHAVMRGVTVHREVRRRHAGIVHAGNGAAHHHGRPDAQ